MIQYVEITFTDISTGISKRTAACCFLEVLQSAPFENIIISSTNATFVQQ